MKGGGERIRELDPRIREEMVRILGQDVSNMGHVVLTTEPPILMEDDDREAIMAMGDDPDAGVRREVILALRDLPTAQVGGTLKKLAASWDGQDRWYLEALGLALRDRESEYLKGLFDGTLYGDLGLPESGKNGNVALPPYFPVDRNEAFISASDPELPPADALSKTIGLAWMIHSAEVLPIVSRILAEAQAHEIQQGVDDVLKQVSDPTGAVILADLANDAKDPLRRAQILDTLARRLDGSWRSAQSEPKVVAAIEAALADPQTRVQGIALAGATGNQATATDSSRSPKTPVPPSRSAPRPSTRRPA